MERRNLVPVHQEPGGEFAYRIANFSLQHTATLATLNAPLCPAHASELVDVPDQRRGTEAAPREEPGVAAAPPSGQDEDLPDFLTFDDDEDAGPARISEEKGPTAALLREYVSLGILPIPTAAPPAIEPQPAAPPPLPLDRVPWLPAIRDISSPLLRLHQEIIEFCRFLRPSSQEEAIRREALLRVQSIVREIWPTAEVEVFGSFATDLYLPTSDLDVVILRSGCSDVPSGLRALANMLSRRGIADNIQVIAKARVPIIKFEEKTSGHQFDLSFDVANGPEAAANVRALMESLPPMRPLVMVLKVFLQQRDLNEVYSGGLGSYALLVMVAAFLQTHPSRRSQGPNRQGQADAKQGNLRGVAPSCEMETNLGTLLVDFFRLFGRSLNYHLVGVSCRRGGRYFAKRNRPGFYQEERPFMLSVEDPNDPDNDLGKNSYNVTRARSAFDWAYSRLTLEPSRLGESLMQRIVRLDAALFARSDLIARYNDSKAVSKQNETQYAPAEAQPQAAKRRDTEQLVQQRYEARLDEDGAKGISRPRSSPNGQPPGGANRGEKRKHREDGVEQEDCQPQRHHDKEIEDEENLQGKGKTQTWLDNRERRGRAGSSWQIYKDDKRWDEHLPPRSRQDRANSAGSHQQHTQNDKRLHISSAGAREARSRAQGAAPHTEPRFGEGGFHEEGSEQKERDIRRKRLGNDGRVMRGSRGRMRSWRHGSRGGSGRRPR